jgi:hypothetical protein
MIPGIRQSRRRRVAQLVSLTIALVGFIAVGASFSVDLGTQTIYVLVAGSGLAMVGLGLFLFF